MANSQLYVDQLKALGAKHGAPVLDIFNAWVREPGWADKWLGPDKLHLPGEGAGKGLGGAGG